MIDNDRLAKIEALANTRTYSRRDIIGDFNADDDVLFLLAVIARLRPAPVQPEQETASPSVAADTPPESLPAAPPETGTP